MHLSRMLKLEEIALLRRIPYSVNNNISFICVYVWLTLVKYVCDACWCVCLIWLLVLIVDVVQDWGLQQHRSSSHYLIINVFSFQRKSKCRRPKTKSLSFSLPDLCSSRQNLYILSFLFTLRLCESRDKILFKGVVLSHPRISILGCEYPFE